MISVASAEKALLNRRDVRGNGNFRTQFIGDDRHLPGVQPNRNVLAPVGYLVEQKPHAELRAHFHIADQFQVFVGGNGKIGGHSAAIGVGHFAGPYTAYGPIVGGDKGAAYMTLRNGWDDGAQFLPEEIERLRPRRGGRREVMFNDPPVGEVALKALGAPSTHQMIEPTEDGLAAWSYRLPPDATVTGASPSEGGGQFWLVMDGAMAHPVEGLMAQRSLVFVTPDEAPFTAKAGPDGLHILAMQFPKFRIVN